MNVIVQKFGGTSVRNEETRSYAAARVKHAVEEGYKVVVVVSAMGRNGDPYATDTLLSLVGDHKSRVGKREKDLLTSCGEVISAVVFSEKLAELGLTAVAMTGSQAGFQTDEEFGEAKITEMSTGKVEQKLKEVDVVVVAGFQGQSPTGEITTLGRGGSDTSATALGAAMDASWVDIFTDVEGVMTADPRFVQKARPLKTVTYNEICNMAYQGAKVIHPRAVEIAMQAKVPIRIRSTRSESAGTLITSSAEEGSTVRDTEDRMVTGIAHMAKLTQIHVHAKTYDPSLQSIVFKTMAEAGISVDFINISPSGVVYTVPDELKDEAIEKLEAKGYKIDVISGCAKVSAVGAGMTGLPGVASKITTALTEKEIPILQAADSHTTIWVLVEGIHMEQAINALHQIFGLDQPTTLDQEQEKV
ncbi:aspartate kinase [Salsuginibacillus kocurii]|uniref:aspartate kinase n=1 Tax=Salsuginibacillus kocurii TaxID=427078 RepID=UPI0003769B03|nr:aspartate kinase [Salsuginibacillus kocurii]